MEDVAQGQCDDVEEVRGALTASKATARAVETEIAALSRLREPRMIDEATVARRVADLTWAPSAAKIAQRSRAVEPGSSTLTTAAIRHWSMFSRSAESRACGARPHHVGDLGGGRTDPEPAEAYLR